MIAWVARTAAREQHGVARAPAQARLVVAPATGGDRYMRIAHISGAGMLADQSAVPQGNLSSLLMNSPLGPSARPRDSDGMAQKPRLATHWQRGGQKGGLWSC